MNLTYCIIDWGKDLPEIIRRLEALCIEYIEDVSGRAILLIDKPSLDKGFELYFIFPYITRFSESYIKGVRRRFFRISRSLFIIRGRNTFLTITYNPRNVATLKQMHEEFSRSVHRLIDLIRKKYGFYGYVKAFEFTESGLIHAHILLIGVGFIHPDWLTNTLNRLGLGYVKHIREFRGNVRDGFNYLLKYIRKHYNWSNHDGGLPTSLVLSWALNLRTYSMSRSLVDLSIRHRITANLRGLVYLCSVPDMGVYGCITKWMLISGWEDWLYLKGFLIYDGGVPILDWSRILGDY
jgi:hypothetical protein